jgi:hypothetical protein
MLPAPSANSTPQPTIRARVLLDFAERRGASSAEIIQCADLDAAKQASRAQLDLDHYYRMLREVGRDPTITGFNGRIGVHMSVAAIPDDRTSELAEVENGDLDFDLRREHVLAAWEGREPGAFIVSLGV